MSNNHESIVKMFYLNKLAEPVINAMGSEEAKKARNELESAIITYLYSSKMSEETTDPADQISWTLESLKYLEIMRMATDNFNEVMQKVGREK